MPFRAVHSDTAAHHVLTDEVSPDDLDRLRADGRLGLLLCPACRTPMHVRAGDLYAPHFAHIHRRDCPSGDDSPERRAARLALYKWLKPKVEARGGTVTIEDWTEGARLPRPIDLRAQFEDDKPSVAFWLYDRQLSPDKRDAVVAALKTLGAEPCWLFTERLHAPCERDGADVTLTTTERERVALSAYDPLGPGRGSIHYLVAGNTRLRTYRGLRLVHQPGTFAAAVFEDDLADILLTRRGALVHPGEAEALDALTRSLAEARSEADRAYALQDRSGVSPAGTLAPWSSVGSGHASAHGSYRSPNRTSPPTVLTPPPDEALCCICGELRHWSTRDGRTGQTKCGTCVGQPWPAV